MERLERLREEGHELGRPFAAYLTDNVYELRIKSGNLNYMPLNGSDSMEKDKMSDDAVQWAYDKYIAGDPEEEALYREERIKADIAQAVYDLRNHAGLSRKRLAELAGLAESVIEDIEEADYEGGLLGIALKIAGALRHRLELRFVSSDVGESVGRPV